VADAGAMRTFRERGEAGRLTLLAVLILAAASAGVVRWHQQSGLAEELFRQGQNELRLRQDGKAALSWAEAESRGHAGAKTELAKLYMSGDGVARNETRAFELYREAAELGYAPAQLGLAELYREGRGVPASAQEALQWYMAAANNSEPRAHYALGRMYQLGQGVRVDAEKAANWYRQAALAGHGDSQLVLGRMLEAGQGIAEDPAEAARWLERAAEDSQLADAYFLLGTLHESGRGVPRDPEQAYFCYNQAAMKLHASAYYRLARLQYLGDGVPRDTTVAIERLKEAGRLGHPEAQYMLGSLFETGEGVYRSETSAKKWYGKAAEQGHPDAIVALRRLGEDEVTISGYQRRRLERERRKEREREESQELAHGRQAGLCDIRGTVEMRTRVDCENRGGVFRPSQGNTAGSFVTVEYEESWSRQRRELERRMREEARLADVKPRSQRNERSQELTSDSIICKSSQGSDGRGRSRNRCSAPKAKRSGMTTSWCREQGYQGRKLFKHENSARRWVSDHCW
jgi:TPR repeat protein